MKNVRIEEFVPPEDFDELTEKRTSTYQKVQSSVYIDRLAETVAKYLSSQ